MVCQGNICRSPMAEGFFLYQLNNHTSSPTTISSAGLAAVVNYPAEPNASKVMQKHDIDISKHRARQLTNELIRQTELILVMTKRHLAILEKQFLSARGKVFLLGHWQNFEIQDPIGQTLDTFETVYRQIELAWQDWKTRVL